MHTTSQAISKGFGRHLVRLLSGIVGISLGIYHFSYRDTPPPLLSTPPTFQKIPPKIWQIYFGYSPLDSLVNLLMTWPVKNQDLSYTLMSNDGANEFVKDNYAHRPEILDTFLELRFPVFRSDLLRYLLLESQGGVYSDLDTEALKPFSEWVPPDVKADVHAIIGIEYDQGDREPYFGMPEPIQFCQWTMAFVPGHSIVQRVVVNVVNALHALAQVNHSTIGELDPPDEDVIPATGPLIWTRTILEVLSEMTGTNVSFRNVTGAEKPIMIGDVLVLPIDLFGSGQPHSGSWSGVGNPDTAMVRHMWKGSWKHGWGG